MDSSRSPTPSSAAGSSTRAFTVADLENVQVASDRSDTEPESDAQAVPTKVPANKATKKKVSMKPYMRKVVTKRVLGKKISPQKPDATKVREENIPTTSKLHDPVIV
jgi:hypothetical protein